MAVELKFNSLSSIALVQSSIMDFSEILVVGVTARALFNLEAENDIFEIEGVRKYREYQDKNQDVPLEMGTAFYLVKSLLELNKQAHKPIVEVVVMSRNSPETGIRILKSIEKYGLDITRLAFSGGEPIAPYIDAFGVDLFLSKDESSVQAVIDSHSNCAAAVIYEPPTAFNSATNVVKIAFDADAVLFNEDSELRFKKEGIDSFHKYEEENKDVPLQEGPFAKLLKKLSKIQECLPVTVELSPLRLAIVSSRSIPAHMRVINTLKKWGVYVNEVYFLGGMPKDKVLKAFGAHIFFDDQDIHLESSSKVVPSGKVPYSSNSPLKKL